MAKNESDFSVNCFFVLASWAAVNKLRQQLRASSAKHPRRRDKFNDNQFGLTCTWRSGEKQRDWGFRRFDIAVKLLGRFGTNVDVYSIEFLKVNF